MATNRIAENELNEGTTAFDLDRRDFLKITGSGLLLFFTIGDADLFGQQRMGRALPTDFNAFLKIGEDGRVSCFTGKIEMGQGIHTSLAQMLAEELDVSLDAVEMVMGDTDLCPWDMGTFGSLSTRVFGPALRSAGAQARSVLLQLGSDHLKAPVNRLTAENGVISDMNDKSRHVSYGDLVKGKKITRRLTGESQPKKPSEFRIIGTSVTRRDAREKVTGAAKYAADIQLPGMLYAKILRPPAHGAKLLDVDLKDAQRVEGVQVVRDGDLIAVLHKYPDVAQAALAKVVAKFQPTAPDLDEKNIFDHLLKVAPEGKSLAEEGSVQKGKAGASTTVEQTYLNDYVAHSPIEPHAATVKVEGGQVTVWASTQSPFSAKEEVAKALGIEADHVRVMPIFVGGGFGGKTRNLQIVEAARLARLSGKPVQVAWTREEEFFYDSFRPAAIVKIDSGIDGSGKITYWDYHVYYAGDRGAAHFYAIPNSRTMSYGAGWRSVEGTHPFATGAWRAPGNNTNTFARESQIDIMAAKAGIDPVEFRLKNLTDEKMRNVLKTAADKFGWTSGKAPSGRGYGIACGLDAGTSVATIVEVEVDKTSGGVRVKRVVCVQDMGMTVNPEGAAIQMEGCIMMGLGYTLSERLRFKAGKISDTNFDTYEIPHFSWLPKIETYIVGDKSADPQGGGEPAIVTIGGAVANGVYDAIGARLLQLPMTPERIKSAAGKG